ncbi:MAG: hypothetical protein CM1200mP41_30080 [Gammaproteobacteria bacterium]|nr:MAG: hypothetical protein CM1200mP41_30080 [Gammaproteobacteria bacterium]
MNSNSGVIRSRVIPYEVVFRDLTLTMIESYLEREQPYGCCGSLQADGLGVAFLTRISGDDPSALIGLPLITVIDLLAQENYFVLNRVASVTPVSMLFYIESLSNSESSSGIGAWISNVTPESGWTTPMLGHVTTSFLSLFDARPCLLFYPHSMVSNHWMAMAAACARIWCMRPVPRVMSTNVWSQNRWIGRK